MKILVVDDEPDMLNLASAILRFQKYEIFQAQNGEEALEVIYSKSPDLLLTDVNMPVMDGFELCRRVRADSRFDGMPIIIVTVRSSNVDQVAGLGLGVDDYIIKPYVPDVLVARVAAVLNSLRKTGPQS